MSQKIKKAHILTHVPFEDEGAIALWLNKQKAVVSRTRFFENPSLPEINGIDLVVVMGGPMSANDDKSFGWLSAEKEFIKKAAGFGVPVLGICLGAQLIASAFGSRVYKNPQKEIGWLQIKKTLLKKDVFNFPHEFMAFHWHADTFDLPEAARLLASSKVCRNQAFQIGKNVIGLQFHLEATRESVKSLLANCAAELVYGPYIQPKERILSESAATYKKINSTVFDILDYLSAAKPR